MTRARRYSSRVRKNAERSHDILLHVLPMVVFRCTRKLLDRLPGPVAAAPAQSTTALGDWYVNLLVAKPEWLLLAVSAHSRLPVVLPARPLITMTSRFQVALVRVLQALDIADDVIDAERRAMEDTVLARTIDRHVLGSLTEFGHAVRFALADGPERSPHELSVWMADTPILPLEDFPDRMTRRLMERRWAH